jgi:hypothetical protein
MKSMFGRMFWVAGDAADGWEKKIEVVDPDPVSISLFFVVSPDETNDLPSSHRPSGPSSRHGLSTRISASRTSGNASCGLT